MDQIKLIVTDDQSLFRNGVKNSLANRPEINVIGEAVNGRDLLNKLEFLYPDMIIMGINMPVMDGVETMPILKEKYPHIKVIILTMNGDHSLIRRMIELGANAYLTKDAGSEKIYSAIIACKKRWLFINETVHNAIT